MTRLLLILLSAGLHALAFPPWSITLLCWVALVPLLYALRDLRPGGAALAGLLWGSAAIWGVAYWVPQALTFYYQLPWWFGLVFCIAEMHRAIIEIASKPGGPTTVRLIWPADEVSANPADG